MGSLFPGSSGWAENVGTTRTPDRARCLCVTVLPSATLMANEADAVRSQSAMKSGAQTG